MNYLKLLIDPENMIAVSIIEKTEFLSFFYFRSMSVLLAPLMANTIDLKLARDDFHIAQLQYLIIDFLTFCIEHHTYHIRNFLQKKDLLRRVLVLLKSKHQYLQLSALRFLRKIIGLKDEQYNLIILRNNLFASIVDAYKANKRRYNLLNSAMIELFEFIRQENIKTLINYFVENFYSDFESITYVKTFHDLKLSYNTQRDKRERILSDSSPTSSTSRFYDHLNTNHILSVQRLRKEERDLDVDEENWFNDDIDENKISSLNHGTLFNDGSDDDDSQPEIASAISTGEPSRTHHSLSDNDDDDDLSPSSHAHYNKPVISIHIGRSPMPSSSSTTDLPLDTSSPTSSQIVEASSPYAMSPALSSIADQYNDDDDDEEEEEDEDEEEEEEEEEPEDDEEENNSDSYSILKKRKLDNNDHERNKVFKPNSDQS
ncbi:unnamed protein product [Rotaria sp. Silwood2]|nr:unnamed protein product [Rotaria sp. Silwood2]